MDARLSAAARALSVFDPLAALRDVALRDDPPALALRGIAMAQLGEFRSAQSLLRRAARVFATTDPLACARCMAAGAEVALYCRDLATAGRGLEEAAGVLHAHGDFENALFARLTLVRRLVLLGEVSEAERGLSSLDLRRAPARIVAVAALVAADIAVRRIRARDARLALERARAAAHEAGIPSLTAEVEDAMVTFEAPVARLRVSGTESTVTLGRVEAIVRSRDVLVDACRREVRAGGVVVSLIARPILLSLAIALGEAAPGEATRETLVRLAFSAPRASDSLRARLRVEIGRLRRVLVAFAEVRATVGGFTLLPRTAGRVLVLLPPTPGEASAVIALLGGGKSWSTSALAAALGTSQRTVQRALVALRSEGRVEAVGQGRSRRWVAPPPRGFATTLSLALTRPAGVTRTT